MLNDVVLPAPFGPMTLTSSFGSSVMPQLDTAVRPPNRIVHAFMCKSGIAASRSGAGAWTPATQPRPGQLVLAEQPLRAVEHQEHEQERVQNAAQERDARSHPVVAEDQQQCQRDREAGELQRPASAASGGA